MRRVPAIVVLIAIAAMASGALPCLHELSHPAHEADSERHDESNCLFQTLLKLPMLGAALLPVVACVGALAVLLVLPVGAAPSRKSVLLLGSRAPPGC